ncbi:MAG TPA: hypothetical protein VL981_14820 [Candidatus Methylacidiphilales bacterium]|nr:hypothetical protein [Candidatus Methylacidiphilales bacterium]
MAVKIGVHAGGFHGKAEAAILTSEPVIEIGGEVADEVGIGNRLKFVLRIDQSQLGASIHEFEEVMSKFPVRAA